MKKINIFKSLKTDQNAVAGVVVAILLIGLFLSIISFIQAVYVPQWMEQKEAEHTDEVLDQFLDLKSSVDILTVTQQKQKPISTSVKMGTKELPFLISQRSYGSLFLSPNDFSINITYFENADEGITDYYVFNLGSLKFSSSNNYYMQKSYIYENGAVILSQSSGEAMIMEPAIYVSGQNNDKLTFNLIGLCGFQNFTSVSGYGTYPIKTEFSFTDSFSSMNVEKISITTSNVKTWKTLVKDTLKDTNLVYLNDYIIEDNSQGFEVIFTEPSGFPVDVTVHYIKTKITPGWTS